MASNNKKTSDALICPACGLWFAGKVRVAWGARRQRLGVDDKCRAKLVAAGDDGLATKEGRIYPTRWRAEEVRETIKRLRKALRSWQYIATYLNMHPHTVRNIGVGMGLGVYYGGPPAEVGMTWHEIDAKRVQHVKMKMIAMGREAPHAVL